MKRFIGSILVGWALTVGAWAEGLSGSRTLIVQPDDGKTAVVTAIDQAVSNLTLTIYELSDPDVMAALERAAQRGVRVRVIYNFHSFVNMGRGDINGPFMRQLEAAGAQTKPAAKVFEVTHQKTFVFDGATAIVMTFNLQPNYFGGTRDFGVITSVPAEVAEIVKVFEADWNDAVVEPDVESLVWSPVNSRAKTMEIISNAVQTLEVYNEELRDTGCLSALSNAARRGVAVRIIAARLARAGVDGNTNGLAQLTRAGAAAFEGTFLYIHAKMILADYGTQNARAFLGSENFSRTSLDRNRELGILVTEPAILDRLHAVFEQDWAKVRTPE